MRYELGAGSDVSVGGGLLLGHRRRESASSIRAECLASLLGCHYAVKVFCSLPEASRRPTDVVLWSYCHAVKWALVRVDGSR